MKLFALLILVVLLSGCAPRVRSAWYWNDPMWARWAGGDSVVGTCVRVTEQDIAIEDLIIDETACLAMNKQ